MVRQHQTDFFNCGFFLMVRRLLKVFIEYIDHNLYHGGTALKLIILEAIVHIFKKAGQSQNLL